LRLIVRVTSTGGLVVTTAGTGSLTQPGAVPAATWEQTGENASPRKVAGPSGSWPSKKLAAAPGVTVKSRSTCRLPLTVMRMHRVSVGTWAIASWATPMSSPAGEQASATGKASASVAGAAARLVGPRRVIPRRRCRGSPGPHRSWWQR
jgi:hypothetical protein